MPGAKAGLARRTRLDPAATTMANPSRKASDARRRVGRPPCGPRTAARSRRAVPGAAEAAPGPVRAAAWSLAARRWAFAPAGQLYRGRGQLILDHLRSHDAR